jgi:hypothetical protein
LYRLCLSAAVVGALLLCAAPAHATHSSFDVVAGPVNGASSGTFHVAIEHVSGTTWTIRVQGEPSDRGGTGAFPKGSVNAINVGFSDASWNEILIQPGRSSGGTTSGGAFAGAPWITAPRDQDAGFSAPSAMNDLDAFGENAFLATIALASPAEVQHVSVALAGGVQQWFGTTSIPRAPQATVDLAPEPASLAMALPGLLPLGLLLHRRKKRSN